MIIHIVQKI